MASRSGYLPVGLRLVRQVSLDSRGPAIPPGPLNRRGWEAVWAGKDGKSDFDRLHSRAHDDAVFLYAFDLLELNGEDYRQYLLEKRKAKLEKILARDSGSSRNTWTEMGRAFLSKPANWDWKVSYRSDGISRIEAVDAKAG